MWKNKSKKPSKPKVKLSDLSPEERAAKEKATAERRKKLAEHKAAHVRNIRAHLDSCNYPYPEEEFRFWPGRKHQIDFVWWFSSVKTKHEVKMAVEIEGGSFFGKGGHRSMGKFLNDMEKYNQMAVDGWTLIRLLPHQIWDDNSTGIDLIAMVMEKNW